MIGVLSAMLLALPAASSSIAVDNGVRQHLELGKEFFQSGSYAQALDAFFWVLASAPENVEEIGRASCRERV